MAFDKYKTADNAFGNLLTGISASATSLELESGEGALFPSGNFIATVVQYETTNDETSAVVKREKVLVSNNASDTFTITRGFDGDTPVGFDAGDWVYLNVVSAVMEDVQDEVTRLETDKLDSSGELRTGLTAYRLLYIDSTGAETELSLGTAGQVLVSGGTTSNPTWEAQSTDINGLTEVTSMNATDEFIVYDGAGNKKITRDNVTENLKQATDSALGVVEKATDAEVFARTDTERYMTAEQTKIFGVRQTTGTTFNAYNDTSFNQTNSTSFVKLREVTLSDAGRGHFTISYGAKTSGGGVGTFEIRVNGTAVDTETEGSIDDYVTYSYNTTSLIDGDVVTLYAKTSTTSINAQVNNFRFQYGFEPMFGDLLSLSDTL